MASRHRRVRRLGSGRLRPQPRRSVIVNKEIKFYSAGQLLAQGADGLLVFEAENFDANQGDVWIVDTARGTPSGGASVVVLTDDVNDTVRSRVVPVVVAAPQINLTAAAGPGGLVLTWAGGAPPYTIEKKAQLSDATWTFVLTTNATTASPLPIQGESGFFRVSGAAP